MEHSEKGKKKTERKRSRTAAGVLALLCGAIGVHKFYLGEWKKGILFFLFFWTGIPGVLGVVEGAHLLGSDGEEEAPGYDVAEESA